LTFVKTQLYLDTLNYPLNMGLRGTPKVELETLTTTDLTYNTVFDWTVTAGKKGYLDEISIASASFTKVLLKLTINDTVVFTDKSPLSGLDMAVGGLLISEGAHVKLEAKSSDGTSITVAGYMLGREI